jgi:hypothetical protein
VSEPARREVDAEQQDALDAEDEKPPETPRNAVFDRTEHRICGAQVRKGQDHEQHGQANRETEDDGLDAESAGAADRRAHRARDFFVGEPAGLRLLDTIRTPLKSTAFASRIIENPAPVGRIADKDGARRRQAGRRRMDRACAIAQP